MGGLERRRHNSDVYKKKNPTSAPKEQAAITNMSVISGYSMGTEISS